MKDKILEGKNIIVTGGARGNGAGIARGMSEHGASVIVFDVNMGEDANTDYRIVDLTDHDLLKGTFAEICSEYGEIHCLVNNAGISIGNLSETYKIEDWQKTLSVNLTAPFQLSQLVGQHMIGREIPGSIINITSLGATLGFPGNPAYCASKGGLRQLTKALACDWAKYDIRVNNVGPGYMCTHMTRVSQSDPVLREERSRRMMLGRWGMPEDLAGICIFLASSYSAYITGQDIYVDGGWTAKGL